MSQSLFTRRPSAPALGSAFQSVGSSTGSSAAGSSGTGFLQQQLPPVPNNPFTLASSSMATADSSLGSSASSPVLPDTASFSNPSSSMPAFPVPGHASAQALQQNYNKAWDQQTAFTSVTGSTLSGPANTSEAALLDSLSRRVQILHYFKQCLSVAAHPSEHPHQQPWMDIIKITKSDLDAFYETERVRKRTNRNYILGCSLASTLDMTGTECARAVLATINEVESWNEVNDKDKTKMRNFFKTSIRTTRKGAPAIAGTMDGVGMGGPSSLALGPSGIELIGTHTPFPLDFFQVTMTIYDLLIEIYSKLSLALIGAGREADMSSSEPANTQSNAQMLENIQKIETKVKKMIAQTCKELDGLARHHVREELASIDPLMARELGMIDTDVKPNSANAYPSTASSPPSSTAGTFGTFSSSTPAEA